MSTEKIKTLRSQGLTYQQIADKIGCAKSTICYHIGNNQKEKTKLRTRQRRKNHPFIKKIESFLYTQTNTKKQQKELHQFKKLVQLKIECFHRNRENNMKYNRPTFTVDDVINKFGKNPKCYLTGQSIDIYKPRTYHFDHIVPVSKGGTNTIDNLGICSRNANQAKHDMTKEEFIELCKQVVEYNKNST